MVLLGPLFFEVLELQFGRSGGGCNGLACGIPAQPPTSFHRPLDVFPPYKSRVVPVFPPYNTFALDKLFSADNSTTFSSFVLFTKSLRFQIFFGSFGPLPNSSSTKPPLVPDWPGVPVLGSEFLGARCKPLHPFFICRCIPVKDVLKLYANAECEELALQVWDGFSLVDCLSRPSPPLNISPPPALLHNPPKFSANLHDILH